MDDQTGEFDMIVDWEIFSRTRAELGAGFVRILGYFREDGEKSVAIIEEAVRREIAEETSVPTGVVRYIASQPWPFGGSQLMIGCVAEALDDAITLDPKELSDALWASKDEVRAALAGEPGRFIAPPAYGESMYDRRLQAQAPGGTTLTVERVR